MDVAEDILSSVMRHGRGREQFRITCPSCSHTRKGGNQKDPTLSINYIPGDRVLYRCWHCSLDGIIPISNNRQRDRDYNRVGNVKDLNNNQNQRSPLKDIPSQATDEALEWLEKNRGIPVDLSKSMGLISDRKYIRKLQMEVTCVGFPYEEEGKTYAVKWRSYPEKGFTQDGSAQTLYLANKIEAGGDLVICEGEIDALSFWAVGIPAVSIPSGGIEPTNNENNAKLSWMRHHDDLLKQAKRIFVASDGDAIGESTAEELARRLKKARCWRISYPEGTKDANDVLVKLGKEAVSKLIQDAKPWPVEGIQMVNDLRDQVMDLYAKGMPPGLSTTWDKTDEIFTVAPGNLHIVTGTPGSGKSTWLDNLLINMMGKYPDFRSAWLSFESPPNLHLARLVSQRKQLPFGKGIRIRMGEKDLVEALDWLNDRAIILRGGEMLSTEVIIDRLESCVRRFGIKAAVVDPFNYIDLGPNQEARVDAINTMLARFKMWAVEFEVALFLVAHPAKPAFNEKGWVPTGYDISGAAHFFNRADFGLTMARHERCSELHVWKAKWSHQGKLGKVQFLYDPPTQTYEEAREEVRTGKEEPF